MEHSKKELLTPQILQKLHCAEQELVEIARRVLKGTTDPFSGVVRFLHERPDNVSLPGYLVNKVLLETFGGREHIPGLINILSSQVKEIIRSRNVINIIKEHPTIERWGNYVIKQKDRVKFEIGRERDKMVLKNISGLAAIEHGIELSLEKILVNPPKLEVTLRLGMLFPQRTIDIL